MGAVNERYRAAERRLMDAIRAGDVCDFADGAEITVEEMVSWGPERTIRATLLRRLLTTEDAPYAKVGVRLRGAVIEGVLDLEGVNVMNLDLERCRLATAKVSGATFTGHAHFTETTFTDDASFTDATFTGDASFTDATFTGDASFNRATFTGDASFNRATFTGQASFNRAAFTRAASFSSTTFADHARFTGAIFTRTALFPGTTFTGDAWFDNAAFAGETLFNRTTFTGHARFTGATFSGDARFDGAAFTRAASFPGTTFSGDARFDGANFTGAKFTGATFSGDASFDSTAFTGDAQFTVTTFTGGASFNRAAFTRLTHFDGATFTRDARFDGATFSRAAWFTGTTFNRAASFSGATFTGDARFGGTTFNRDASFIGATFTDDAWFGGATFTCAARFERTTFTRAWFDDAAFTDDARFGGAIADAYDFSRAQFHTADPGPWVAGQVTLNRAVFHVRARLTVVAATIYCRRLQAREGVHLVVRGGAVDLEDAEFLRRSILAHSESVLNLPKPNDPGRRPEGFEYFTPAEQARWMAKEEAFQLAMNPASKLTSQHLPQTRVVSLRRATAGDLVLSGVGLENCAFAGAHDLDKLHIDATCSFQHPPTWPSRTWRPFTSRCLIAEEAQWRQAHTPGWATTSAAARQEPGNPVPTALEIAGIYRDLRKGLEDAKDEPGAGDFYYGEMEMRRLSARGHSHRSKDDGVPNGRRPSWTERRLLDAYWAVSGYGLRAWRAVTALTVLLVGCAALFTLPAFAHLPDSPPRVASVSLRTGAIRYAPITQPRGKTGTTATVPFGTSLKFTSAESLTLLRGSAAPLLETTSVGTVLDIALRLLAPLLLGLALLAVRGRIKR